MTVLVKRVDPLHVLNGSDTLESRGRESKLFRCRCGRARAPKASHVGSMADEDRHIAAVASSGLVIITAPAPGRWRCPWAACRGAACRWSCCRSSAAPAAPPRSSAGTATPSPRVPPPALCWCSCVSLARQFGAFADTKWRTAVRKSMEPTKHDGAMR